jgi:serine/threonine protein kinase
MTRGEETQTSWAERAFSIGAEIRDDADGARYRVVRLLGRGGMGEVHEVVRADTGARYALKCLLLQHARNEKTIERTRREATTLRELRHPNVVRVHATGVREDGLIWMVMDLLEGHTLAAAKRRLGKLPLPWALRLGRAVAEGLTAVHRYAVHRDVKPDNIHLGNDGVVRVLDLGAGKFHLSGLLTTGNRTLGTVPYMSPEQLVVGGIVDGRSDLFSLAVVLTELVSGVHPFAPAGLASENVFTLVRRIVDPTPVSLRAQAPWVPDYIAATIDRALSRERHLRPADAAEMAAALGADLERLEREVGSDAPLSTLVRELNRRDEPGERPSSPPAEAPPAEPQAAEAAVVATDEADTEIMVRRRT